MSHIVTLTGPSCGGKSTLESKLVETGHFEKVVSHTTRAPRAGEVNGKDYYFVSREEFGCLYNDDKLVEMVEFNGNFYGVSVEEVKRVFASGKHVVVVCEPNGAQQIQAYARRHSIAHLSVFVDAPVEVIARRFLARFMAEKEQGVSLDAFSKRLAIMMTTERGWLVRADTHYKLYVDRFDADNEASVIAEIGELSGLKHLQYLAA